jgi:hypothetical protein
MPMPGAHLSVNRTACKRRLQVPSGGRLPQTLGVETLRLVIALK